VRSSNYQDEILENFMPKAKGKKQTKGKIAA